MIDLDLLWILESTPKRYRMSKYEWLGRSNVHKIIMTIMMIGYGRLSRSQFLTKLYNLCPKSTGRHCKTKSPSSRSWWTIMCFKAYLRTHMNFWHVHHVHLCALHVKNTVVLLLYQHLHDNWDNFHYFATVLSVFLKCPKLDLEDRSIVS